MVVGMVMVEATAMVMAIRMVMAGVAPMVVGVAPMVVGVAIRAPGALRMATHHRHRPQLLPHLLRRASNIEPNCRRAHRDVLVLAYPIRLLYKADSDRPANAWPVIISNHPPQTKRST